MLNGCQVLYNNNNGMILLLQTKADMVVLMRGFYKDIDCIKVSPSCAYCMNT